MQRMLEGSVGGTLARLAAPNVVVSGAQLSVTLADAWYLGQLGVTALAAVAMVYPVQAMMQMMSAGAMGGGISSAIARALGGGNRERADSLFAHAILIAAAMAALFTLLFAVLAAPFLAFLGGRGAALEGAVAYAHILFGGAIAVWLANTLASVLRGTGNMMVPAVVMSITAILNVVLSGALTLGWFGFPALGVRGPAAAFISAFAIAAILMGFYVAAGRAGIRPRLAGLGFAGEQFADILRVGGVACGNALLTIATVVAVTGLVARYGTAALAGYGLGSRLELMLIVIAFGAGGAMTAMVGANRGHGAHARARRIAWTGGLAVFAVTSALGIAVAVHPGLWIDWFTADADAASAAATYLRIVGPFYGFFGMGMALYFASQGTGTMIWPFAAGVVRIVVAAGLGTVAVTAFGLPLDWVFACVAAGLVAFGGMIAGSLFARPWNPDRP